MKKALTVLLLTAAALTAQASASTGSTKQKAVKKTVEAKQVTSAAQALTIPKGSVANPDGSYSWTDKQGRKWRFVRTPFGISRTEVTGVPMAAASLNGVKAFDAGDKIRFEAPTPFGTTKWEKSKTELTDEERSLVDSQNAKQE